MTKGIFREFRELGLEHANNAAEAIQRRILGNEIFGYGSILIKIFLKAEEEFKIQYDYFSTWSPPANYMFSASMRMKELIPDYKFLVLGKEYDLISFLRALGKIHFHHPASPEAILNETLGDGRKKFLDYEKFLREIGIKVPPAPRIVAKWLDENLGLQDLLKAKIKNQICLKCHRPTSDYYPGEYIKRCQCNMATE